MERNRCNTCGAYFTAQLPQDVLKDGSGTQKYGYSARSLMAIYKYFAGLPFYRQSSIQKLLGVKLTASTVFDQVEQVCDAIYPVYQHLFSLAADAVHYAIDDTTHRILDAKPIEKKFVTVIKHNYAVVCIPQALSPPRRTINTSCYSKPI